MEDLEASLLDAIATDPRDARAWHVLADRLTDRADPRAELIRLEAAAREGAPWSEEFWHHRGERDALWRACDPMFVARVDPPLPYRPLLPELPSEWRARFRALRALLTQWLRHSLPSIRHPAPASAESVRGLPSSAISEWSALLQDLVEADVLPPGLRDPVPQIRLLPEHGAMALHDIPMERVCAVPYDRLYEPDPLVEWHIWHPKRLTWGATDKPAMSVSEFAFVTVVAALPAAHRSVVAASSADALFAALPPTVVITAMGPAWVLEGHGWLGVVHETAGPVSVELSVQATPGPDALPDALRAG